MLDPEGGGRAHVGENVVRGLCVVGGEQTAAGTPWLADRTQRGLARPPLVLRDGRTGAAAAPEAITTVWWGTLATGGIRMRTRPGDQTRRDTTLRQAA